MNRHAETLTGAGERPALVSRGVPAAGDSPDAAPEPVILYVGSVLPMLSDTFVYREVLSLREGGATVHAASVHPPQRNLSDPGLAAMAEDATPIYGAGAARLLADAAKELLSRPGRSIRTLGRGLADGLFDRDVTLGRRPKVMWQVLAGLALAHRVRPKNVGHIHAHMAHVPTTIAMYAAMQLGASLSFTGHAADLFVERTLLAAKVRRAAFVACISTWHRQLYREVGGVSEDRLPIIHCGVDIEAFRSADPAESDRPHVLSVGRLVEKKGFDVLMRAVAILRDRGVGLRCTIAGDGPQREELDRLHADLRLDGIVELAGPQPNSRVRDLMRTADLFVLPCRVAASGDRDGIPVALIEALGCEVCAISGDIPTIRDLIEHERTGLMVEPGDVGALADAMQGVLGDAEERRRLGLAGRQRVVEEFNLRRNVERLRGMFAAATPTVRRARHRA